MKELQLKELNINELEEINGGWSWTGAEGGAVTGGIATAGDPIGALVGGIIGGLAG